MNATMRFLIWGTLPLGTLLGGVLGDAIGLRPTLVIAGVGSVLACLPLVLSPIRSLREIPALDEAADRATGAVPTPVPVTDDER